MGRERKYCSYCSNPVTSKLEGENLRDYCDQCNTYFYDNPLPVASAIVVSDRKLLLVKRKNEPQKGEWCLPSGFAETGESIEEAALRELEEEAGIKGKIIDFVSVDSAFSSMYGDLIFVTFEAEWTGGIILAGDDAEEVGFFSFQELPALAFESNVNAVKRYLQDKQEYWAIVDSFTLSMGEEQTGFIKGDYLSDKLVGMIEKNAEVISRRWLQDVMNNKSTPTYASADPDSTFQRNLYVVSHFGKWLSGYHNDRDVRNFYFEVGLERKREKFSLSEVLSAISLTRKHIWEFALAQKLWTKTIDIYMTLELERRMMLFFDRAAYYAAKGYEAGNKEKSVTKP
ncbi:MAG: NUDIX hydrolase [Bacteroidales bacterium]|nr:NUDIX hydrolase [Bacteroidales bacterium]